MNNHIFAKVLVCDFDNVVTLNPETGRGTEDTKKEAWQSVFPEMPAAALDQRMVDLQRHIEGGKGDRDTIIRALLLDLRWSAEDFVVESANRSRRFNQIVQEIVVRVGVPLETRDVLARLTRRMPVYINSATPLVPLLTSLDALGIRSLFKEVYARPGTKVDNLRAIIQREACLPCEVVFVDDQPSGWNVSQEVCCQFVGMRSVAVTAWHQGDLPFPVVRSFRELLKLLC